MISAEKVRHMTEVAMLLKKGERREAEVCKYRRKDYIALHMFGIWVSSTVAYFLITIVLLIFMLGKNPDQYIAFETMMQAALLWGMTYMIFCLGMQWLAWICYSARYKKSRIWQRKYHYALRMLEEYYNTPTEPEAEDDWQIDMRKEIRKDYDKTSGN